MALNDIRPHSASRGGSQHARAYPMAASATFLRGEPTVLTSGALDECGDDPDFVAGIAMMRGTDVDGAALATGSPITVLELAEDQDFVCNNFATDGAGTAATPTQANAIGLLAGFTLNGSDWFVDTGCANLLLEITDVLNSQGISITNPLHSYNTTGVSVVFKVVT